MDSKTLNEILDLMEAQVRSRPSALEFEMAYQARVAIDRIRFAIKHAEQFGQPTTQAGDALFQLLDALDRLESAERNFQRRIRPSLALGAPESKTEPVTGKTQRNEEGS